jgi:hypothetical protein
MKPQAVKPLHIPAGLPIDEATRPEMLDVGTANLVNVNVRMNNRQVLVKRRGYAAISASRLDGTTRSAGNRMFMNGQQVCTIDGTNLDVYSDSVGVSVLKSRVPEASVKLAPAPSVSGSAGDTAIYGNYLITSSIKYDVGVNAVSAYVCVVDAFTGTVLSEPTRLGSSVIVTTVRLVVLGSAVYAFVFGATSTTITQYKLDLTSTATLNSGWSLVGTVGTDYFRGGCAVIGPSGTLMVVAWVNNDVGAGISRVTVATCNASGAVASVTVNTSGGMAFPAGPNAVALSEGSSIQWLAWDEDTARVRVRGLDTAALGTPIAATATAFTASNTPGHVQLGALSGGKCVVYASNSTGATTMRAMQNTSGTAAGAGSAATLAGTDILSRPQLINGRLYAHFQSYSASGLVLCDCTPDLTSAASLVTYLRPVAAAVVRGITCTSGDRIVQIGSTSRYTSTATIKRTAFLSGTTTVEYDFASPYRWKSAHITGSTVLGGGITSVFDGTRVFEAGFLDAPYQPFGASTGVAGSITFTLGGRRYVTTYEEMDSGGNVHTSGVSAPSVLTGNVTSKSITVTIYPFSMTMRGYTTAAIGTAKPTSFSVVLWGTVDGGTGPYYRIGQMLNDPNVVSLTYTDNTFDSLLIQQPLLYGTGALPGTSGSSQDHRTPPGLLHVVAYNGMIVGANGSTLWYSSQPIDGEGQWFSPVFTQSGTVDDDITALAVQDGSILVFCRRSVFVTNGDPPADNASSGGLSVLRKLSIDQGCTNANSVLTTSMGTFYQSDRGLELITRGQTNAFIGEGIQNELATYPVITSATLDTVSSLARFSLTTSQSSGIAATNGKDIIFDLTSNAWVSVDDKRGSTETQASQDSCMAYVNGAWCYAWLATNGVVYCERAVGDAAECLDGSSFVVSQYELPPLKLGLQQEMRIWEMAVLFERVSACGMTIEQAYDFSTTYGVAPDKVWTEAGLAGLRQVSFRPDPLRNAIGLRVRDTAPAVLGTGKGLAFIGISADVAPKQGTTRGTPRLAVSTRR